MGNNKKLGFLQKIILSITDFRFYPYILKTEKLSRSFLHFILFIMIIAAVITCKFSFLLFDRIDNFMSKYDEIVPEFSLKDGSLSISTNDVIILENEVVFVDKRTKQNIYMQTNDKLQKDNLGVFNRLMTQAKSNSIRRYSPICED